MNAGHGEGMTTVPCEPDLASPVASLAQLYAQALALSVLLRGRCRRWAAGSGGRVDRLVEGERDDRAGPGDSDEVPGDEMKGPVRAAEKAVVRYGGDVSQLLDICRWVKFL